MNTDITLARQCFQAFWKRLGASLWHLTAQNSCTLLERHWFSLIKSGKNYWAKVRETKKQILSLEVMVITLQGC
jgi:hypothetical protein